MTTTATAATTTTWIRFGALPKTIAPQDWHPWDMINLRSRNHAEGGYEAGVSVYPGHVEGTKVYVDLTGIGAGSALFILDPADVWQVTGRRVTADDYWDQTVDAYSDGVELDHDPVGSDGEPLIWVHFDDRDFAARRVRCTELWAKLTTNGEWTLTAERLS